MITRKRTRREFLRIAALGAIAATGAGLWGGCGPARAAAEIGLAAGEEDVPEAQIERFNQEFAPYHVTRVSFNFEKLVEGLAAGNAPDVAVAPALKVPWLAGCGALRNVAGLFQASATASKADLFAVDGYFTSAGQRWGMALSWSPDYLVWANTQLWQQAGVDLPEGVLPLEEWRRLSARLSAVGAAGAPVFGTDFTFDFPALLWLAETLDPPARLFGEDGRGLDLRARPDFVQAVRFVLDWKKEGGIPFRRATDLLQSFLPGCN